MKNRMKEMFAAGEAAFGVSLMFPSPQLVEMVAYAGFDWVLIDCEHGSIGLADVEDEGVRVVRQDPELLDADDVSGVE